jgi:integrase
MKGFKFTKANLEQLRPGEKEFLVWSEALPGFGVRVSPTGKRAWIVQFRTNDGRARRRTIGDLRTVPMTIAEQRAHQVLAHARAYGVDLIEQERDAAQAKRRAAETSIGSIAAAYLAEPEVRRRKSFGETRRYLEVVWAPAHQLDAETCTRHDLIPTLKRIASERGETTGNRAKAALSACFSWAIRHGLLKRDNLPTAFLPSWRESPRERVLNLEELAAIWRTAPLINEQFARMLKLLILSGARRSEISDLDWSEVDLNRGLISLSGARTKTAKAHLIPLAPAAVEILTTTPRLSASRCFPNFSAWSWAKQRLDAVLQFDQPWTVHDVRRSCSTLWRELLDADPAVAELQLGHRIRNKIAAVYDRSQMLNQRRQLLADWAALIVKTAGEPAPAAAANVVPLRGPGR